jgi:hypothetical protein
MTNQTKYTPGPWHKSGTDIVKPHPQATTEFAKQQGYIIARSCYATSDGNPTEETLSNAALIAAAPELLEALKTIEKAFVESPGTFNYSQYEDVVVAAIAKAEGKS